MTAKHFIGNAWISNGDIIYTKSPSDQSQICDYHKGSQSTLEDAIHSARTAFESDQWKSRSRLRAQFLIELADGIRSVEEQLVLMITSESGKVISQVRHEVKAAINECIYYAGLSRAQFGRVAEFDSGQQSLFTREPIGVAAIIVPWNAPATLLIRSLAPAVAAGCTAVIKPAHESAGSHGILMQCIARCSSLVPGAINSVNDGGIAMSQMLVSHPEIDVISYTGSTATGKKIMEAAAGSLKRLSLELGGKSPAIIFEDASIDQAIDEIVRGAMPHSGQMCTAIGRVLVPKNLHSQVVALLVNRLSELKIGHALSSDSQIGPLINEAAAERYSKFVDQAKKDGEMHLTGERLDSDQFGSACYVSPTVASIDDVNHSLVQTELFSPFLLVETFVDKDEAIHRANSTTYGLSASVYTKTAKWAQRAARQIKAGTVWINCHNRLMVEAETGGYRTSGLGRLHGVEGLAPFLETKHIYSEFGEW